MNGPTRPRREPGKEDAWDAALGVFEALARPGRLGIYRAIVRAGPAGVPASVLVRQLRTTGSALTFHLRALSEVGLVRATTSGDWDGERTVMLTGSLDRIEELVARLRAEDRAAPGAADRTDAQQSYSRD